MITRSLKYITLTIGLLFSTFLISQQAGYKFIENKGQFPEQVHLKTDLKAGNLFLEKDRLLFDLYDIETVNKYIEAHYKKELRHTIDKLHCHAYAVNFVNANPNHKIEKLNQTTEYYNYFLGNDKSKWASKAYGYFRVNYIDLYPNVDFKIYSKYFNLKYDFIVHPGQTPDVIQLNYEGADNIAVKNGRLHIYTSVNHLIEDKPFAYQIINGTKKEVACEFKLIDNNLSFSFPEGYNKSYDLVIDPTLIFSTYSGSTADNFGYSATFDSKGFLYSGSSAFGQGYPVVLGSYDVSFNGGSGLSPGVDMAISKFDTTGTFLIYSTYLGGNSDELPHSLIVNSLDELFILGSTSSPNFPYTTGCYDSTFNGGTPNNLQNGLGVYYINGSDITVSHLSTDGATLLGSTYIGGSQNDGLNSISANNSQNTLRYNYADEVRGEIDIDKNNNIYVVSCTRSSDFPTTPGTVQPTYGGGAMDGCAFMLDNGLQNLIWSTFIGGSDADAAYSLAIDRNDDIYVAGGTNSTDLPTTPSVLYPTFQGGRSDGFITHITSDGKTLLNSTYYGSATYDQTYFVELDRYNNVYILGQTEATNNQFIINALYSNPGSGQVICKMTPQMDSVIYSTVFGAGNGINISPTAFLVDYCNKIYLAGWGGVVNNINSILYNNAGYTYNMPITSDAFQSTTDGSDFYIMVLQDDASALVYGSYFGGPQSPEHVDGGTSRFDRKGKVYEAICASCGGYSDLPIYPANAVSDSNRNSCNLGVFKMDFNLPVVVADFETPPIGCTPYTYTFNNTSLSQNYTSYQWDFGDGNGTSTQLNPTYTYNQTGTYTVTLVVKDTATCNFNDTIQKTITILGDTTYSITAANICPGQTTQIGFPPSGTANLTYQWSPQNTLSAGDISNPFATPTTTTNYQLLISNGVCTDTVNQQVIVNTPLVSVSGPPVICDSNGSSSLTANSFGTSTTYLWSTTNNFSDTLQSGTGNNYTVTAPSEGIFYVQVDNNGCKTYDSVSVNYVPEGSLTSTMSACYGDSLDFFYSNTELDSPTFNWVGGTPTTSTTDSYLYTMAPYSDSVYVVVNNGGCIDTLVAHYSIFSPDLSVSNDTTLCTENEIITLNANSSGTADSFVWSTNNAFNDTINNYPNDSVVTLNPTTTGSYYIQIQQQGCYLTDSVFVTVATSQLLLSGNSTICLGDSVTLSAVNQNPGDTVTLLWQPDSLISGDNTLYSITVAPTNTTTFTLTGTNQSGCTINDSVIVNVDQTSTMSTNITASPDSIYTGQSSTLQASPSGYNYTWTPSNGLSSLTSATTIASPDATTTYKVTYTSPNGCLKTDSVTVYVVEIICGDPDVYVPNAFSPNGDGKNDVLYVRGNFIESLVFRVYDRWGELVFETTDQSQGWDGMYKGKPSDPAVFDYYLETICWTGDKYFKKGNITLIR